MRIVFILPMKLVWRWGALQWHNVSTKFCENQATGSEVESEDTRMFGRHGYVIRF